jgi:hypothetical protein
MFDLRAVSLEIERLACGAGSAKVDTINLLETILQADFKNLELAAKLRTSWFLLAEVQRLMIEADNIVIAQVQEETINEA